MSYEQLILQNNSLNEIVVFLWFFPYLSDYVHPIKRLAGCEERLTECR